MEDISQLSEAKELLRLLKLEQSIIASDGLAFYDPAGEKHKKFHANGDKKYRYVRSGNRFGKSDMGGAEDIAWLRGERSWLDKSDPARYLGIPKQSVRGLLIVENWDKADEIFTCAEQGASRGKLFKYIPYDSFISASKNHGGHIDTIYVQSIWGGTSILKIDTVVSFKQDPMSGESSQWDFIHVDEPIPYDMWEAVSRGLMDTGGKAWFTCTPLIHMWINDFFFKKDKKLSKTLSTDVVIGNRFILTGSSYDNKYIKKEDIDEYASTLKKAKIETRIYGRPSGAEGVVYDQFVFDEHVYLKPPHGWSDMDEPPQNFTIRAAIDPHAVTARAILCAATDPFGYVFFFKEYFQEEHVKSMCAWFNETMVGKNLLLTLLDPIAYIENSFNETCWADDILQEGIVCERAAKDLARGIPAVQEFLSRRDANGRPMCYFSEQLAETLYEFDHYVWNPKTPGKPVDKDDHMMENLYRLVLGGLEFIDMDDKDTRTFYPQANPGLDLSIPRQTEGQGRYVDPNKLENYKAVYDDDDNYLRQ